ncbi:MAG: peptide ABC transporter substrate-binding protein [Chloroflexi bacterium]|nr:peptide ABC transporter substrate-binding protein [Chloroflexota bacterium]
MKWLLLFAAVVLLAARPFAASAQQQPPVPQTVTLNFLTNGEPTSLDPSHASSAAAADGAVVRQVFEPLLRFDEHLVPQPAAASSYEVSLDGTLVTFHLRPDGRWSDGQPVTAADFEYAWKRLLDPSLDSEYAPLFVDAGIVGADDYNAGKVATADHVGINALDDLTLQVRLNQPFGALPDLAALWVAAPLRPDIVDANPDSWATDPATYIGNGPFKVTDWVHQDHLTLVPNPQYTAHLGWPTPTITRATILMHSNPETDFNAYTSGSAPDWVDVPDADVNQVLNEEALATQSQRSNALTTFWVQINTAHPPLDDARVRRALSRAVDRTALVHDLTAGLGLPTTSVVPPGMPGFQDGLGQDLAFDASAARGLLSQAGFGADQPLPTLQFLYPESPANARRALFLQAQWTVNLGIDVELNPLDADAYQQAIDAGNYDLAFGGWTADYPDPQDWFGLVFGCNGAFNTFAYCDTSVDELVARADMSANSAQRLQLYAQAQTQLLQDVPVLPLFVRGRLALVKPWIQSTSGGPLILTAMDEYSGSLFLDKVQVLPH